MNVTQSSMTQIACQVREVHYVFEYQNCDQCQQASKQVGEAERTAIDIDIEEPVLLQVRVSVHYCPRCEHYFRAQPPFLRPDAIYTNRVVDKAVASVFEDGMAMRRVSRRLARDFYVHPSEGMIRRWCRAYPARFDFATDYQPWVVENFSGILCVDEVYQGRLALLLAVDPAAPSGDRLVGYQLMDESVTAQEVETFLSQLKSIGVDPDEVITDGSTLYPTVLGKVWPTAAHQLCLFHETRHVTKAVSALITQIRQTVPTSPQITQSTVRGRVAAHPPTEDPDDSATQHWYVRQIQRHRMMAEVHQLRQAGFSQRAIARQTGLSRNTIKKWLKQEVPPLPANIPPTVRQSVEVSLSADRSAGSSQTAVSEVPPPAPWTSWDEVRQTKEALHKHRFLFVRRPAHLSDQDEAHLQALLESPLGPQLQVARDFLLDWYRFWSDEEGARRSLSESQTLYAIWRNNPAYRNVPKLRKAQDRIPPERFTKLTQFLNHPEWEATNNGAERSGRAFRHRQAPHFNLRSKEAIDGAITVAACQQKEATLNLHKLHANFSTRGRKTSKMAA